ncbi:MAG: hypothetical protein AB7O38_14815, partial [Pirellulaceae bacterium]
LADLEPRYRSRRSPALDPGRILDYGQPDLVLASRGQPTSVNVMFRNMDEWTLLYQDRVAQVWGRTTIYGNPTSPQFIPAARRSITDKEQTGSVTWPALPVVSQIATPRKGEA